MLKLALGILVVFFISLFERGIDTAILITFVLIYSLAGFMVPFKIVNIKEAGAFEFKFIDFFGVITILLGLGLGLFYWGFSKKLLLLFSPTISGIVVILITYLSVKVLRSKT